MVIRRDLVIALTRHQFAGLGYQVLLITDHDRGFTEDRFQQHRAACHAASNSRILLVPGIEYSDDSNLVHILRLGCISLPWRGTSDL